MTTDRRQSLRWPAKLAAGWVLFLGQGLPWASARGFDEPPPSPIQVGGAKPPVVIQLPAQPVEPGKAQAAEPGEKAKAAPKKGWDKIVSPKHVVPDKVMVFFWVPDLKQVSKAFPRSALGGLIREEQIQAPAQEIVARLRRAYVEGDGTLPEAESRRRASEVGLIAKLGGALQGTVAVAVDTPDLKKEGNVSALPRFMIVIGMADEKVQKEISDAMEVFATAQLQDARFRDDTAKIGPYEVRQIKNDALSVCESWAFVENLFLYGWGQGLLEEGVTAYHLQSGKGTLGVNPGFNAGYDKVGADALAYAQFDGTELLKRAMADQPMLATFARPLLEGFEQNRPQVAVGLQVMEGEKECPLKEKLLLRVARSALPQVTKRCEAATRVLASSDVMFYGAQQGTLEGVLRWLTAESGDAARPNPCARIVPALMQALKQDQPDQLWKLFAPFQGELAAILDYVPGEAFRKDWQEVFQLVFAVEINRDERANAEAVLKRLRDATQVNYKQMTFQGTDILYQEGAAPDEKDKGAQVHPLLTPKPPARVEEGKPVPIPFFVACAIHNLGSPDQPRPFLLLSDNLKALKKAIQQFRFPKHALSEREDFRRVVSTLDEGRYTLNYLDLPSLVSTLYRQILPELVRIRAINKEVLGDLPPDTVILRHLSPMIWASTIRGEEGQLTEVISPAGNLPLLGLVGALAWPAYTAQQQQEIAAKMGDHLKQISLGLQLYAAVFDRFPAKLSDLFPEYVSDLTVFASPFDRLAIKSPEDIDDWRKSNLVYLPGRSFQDLSQEILVYEVKPTMVQATEQGYRQFHQVLQLNGMVRSLPLSRMRFLLGPLAGPLAEAAKKEPPPRP